MQTINWKIENFKQNVYNLVNESQLPVSIIYYIITLLQKEVQLQYYTTLNMENNIQKQNKQDEDDSSLSQQ